jgi:hypothetical protein
VKPCRGSQPAGWSGLLILSLIGILLPAAAGRGLSAQPAGQGVYSDRPPPSELQDRLERLRSVPYVDFSPEEDGDDRGGVILQVQQRTWPGYNFYCSRTAGRIYLLDMDGRPAHQWIYHPKKGPGSDYAVLLPSGDLLVIKKHEALLRLDWDSNVIWKKQMRPHHDLAVTPEGNIYVIVRDWESYRGMRVWFDVLLLLAPDGEEIGRWHTYEHLDDLKSALDTGSFLDTVLDSALGGGPETGPAASVAKTAVADDRYNFDYFHLNAVSLIPETPLGRRDERFQPGNLLICLRNVNQVVVLERGTYRILWSWGQGILEWPHHPTMLPDGHILVFDNGVNRRYSRVLEVDPEGESIVWEYQADPPDAFFSNARGAAQRLSNGNTLITESDRGRVFEVAQEGDIVWTWLNPIRKKDHRQTVYRMLRLPAAEVEPLLHRWWWK